MVKLSDINIENFFKKVNKTKTCWEWTGMLDDDGYGRFKIKGTPKAAHRLSMIIEHGSVPTGMWVLHNCDNRKCVNPNHLYFGTPSMNSMDRENRGRGRSLIGENNGYNKLVDSSVIQIKGLIRNGVTGREIAKKFNVTPSLISLIKNNKIWTHINN